MSRFPDPQNPSVRMDYYAHLKAKSHLSIREWVFLTGICRSTTYLHVLAGTLKTIKLGKRRLVPISEVKDFFVRNGVA